MIYISKGILKSSLRKPLKVTRCGKTVQLSGLQAEDNRRWINIKSKVSITWYGDSFLGITDLEQLPAKLTAVVKKHIRI